MSPSLSRAEAAKLRGPKVIQGAPSNGVTPQTPDTLYVFSGGVAVESGGRLLAWVPGKLTNPDNGSHKHWSVAAKTKKAWRIVTAVILDAAVMREGARGTYRMKPETPKHVVITAFVWNLFDDEGLFSALKPVVDGLRDAGILHDDSPRSGHHIDRRQVIDRKRRGVEVVIEPRGESA